MSRYDGGVRTSRGSTSVVVSFEPNGYSSKNFSVFSCVFCSSDMQFFVRFVGLLLGGGQQVCLWWSYVYLWGFTNMWASGAVLGRGGRGIATNSQPRVC